MPDSSNPVEAVRLVLADDHVMFREGLRALLERWPEVEIVGEAGNGTEAVDLARQLRPDVMVMDIGMPEMNGLEATRLITRELPDVKVLILTIHATDERVVGPQDLPLVQLRQCVQQLRPRLRGVRDFKRV